jgi:hypothetical protein
VNEWIVALVLYYRSFYIFRLTDATHPVVSDDIFEVKCKTWTGFTTDAVVGYADNVEVQGGASGFYPYFRSSKGKSTFGYSDIFTDASGDSFFIIGAVCHGAVKSGGIKLSLLGFPLTNFTQCRIVILGTLNGGTKETAFSKRTFEEVEVVEFRERGISCLREAFEQTEQLNLDMLVANVKVQLISSLKDVPPASDTNHQVLIASRRSKDENIICLPSPNLNEAIMVYAQRNYEALVQCVWKLRMWSNVSKRTSTKKAGNLKPQDKVITVCVQKMGENEGGLVRRDWFQIMFGFVGAVAFLNEASFVERKLLFRYGCVIVLTNNSYFIPYPTTLGSAGCIWIYLQNLLR